jgi:hypothetical protein
MTTITLPPLLTVTVPYTDRQTEDIRARDLEVARLVLEGAAYVLTVHQIPVGNSAAGELACQWTYDALKECRDTIRNIEVKHHE